MAAFAVQVAARLSVLCFEAHSMRFTVVATGQFRPGRAFGFGLAASSLTRLSVVKQSNSTGGTRTRVAASFTGARPNPEIASAAANHPARIRVGEGAGWRREAPPVTHALLLVNTFVMYDRSARMSIVEPP